MTKKLFKNIAELQYPPANVIKEKGRLIDIGESVAYLAASSLSTFAEFNCNYYQPICFAEISYPHKDEVAFFTAGVRLTALVFLKMSR